MLFVKKVCSSHSKKCLSYIHADNYQPLRTTNTTYLLFCRKILLPKIDIGVLKKYKINEIIRKQILDTPRTIVNNTQLHVS